jgi:hypothetical protein
VAAGLSSVGHRDLTGTGDGGLPKIPTNILSARLKAEIASGSLDFQIQVGAVELRAQASDGALTHVQAPGLSPF